MPVSTFTRTPSGAVATRAEPRPAGRAPRGRRRSGSAWWAHHGRRRRRPAVIGEEEDRHLDPPPSRSSTPSSTRATASHRAPAPSSVARAGGHRPVSVAVCLHHGAQRRRPGQVGKGGGIVGRAPRDPPRPRRAGRPSATRLQPSWLSHLCPPICIISRPHGGRHQRAGRSSATSPSAGPWSYGPAVHVCRQCRCPRAGPRHGRAARPPLPTARRRFPPWPGGERCRAAGEEHPAARLGHRGRACPSRAPPPRPARPSGVRRPRDRAPGAARPAAHTRRRAGSAPPGARRSPRTGGPPARRGRSASATTGTGERATRVRISVAVHSLRPKPGPDDHRPGTASRASPKSTSAGPTRWEGTGSRTASTGHRPAAAGSPDEPGTASRTMPAPAWEGARRCQCRRPLHAGRAGHHRHRARPRGQLLGRGAPWAATSASSTRAMPVPSMAGRAVGHHPPRRDESLPVALEQSRLEGGEGDGPVGGHRAPPRPRPSRRRPPGEVDGQHRGAVRDLRRLAGAAKPRAVARRRPRGRTAAMRPARGRRPGRRAPCTRAPAQARRRDPPVGAVAALARHHHDSPAVGAPEQVAGRE